MSLSLPRLTSPYISLTSPLTPRSLISIQAALRNALAKQPQTQPDSQTPNAAVLIPLCNIENKPSIIFEVRGKLRMHSGEVSFPGGRVDDTDESFLHAALREANEEIGLSVEQVEVLGEIGPAQISLGGMRVWPYVGYVYNDAQSRIHLGQNTNLDAPIPSLSMSTLKAIPPEVAYIFHLPLAELVQPVRLHLHQFRGVAPYWAVNVTDMIGGSSVDWTVETPSINRERQGTLEIWGLTGWYVNVLMRVLEIFR